MEMAADHILDVFDYDLDIDFETAYEMINDEDQNLKSNVHQTVLENEVDRWSTSDLVPIKRENEGLNPHSGNHHREFENHKTDTHRAGLLSEFESTAIEHFLDSLVSSTDKDGKMMKDQFLPAWEDLPRELSHQPHTTTVNTKGDHLQAPCDLQQVVVQKPTFMTGQRQSTSSVSYTPVAMKSAEITVSDSEIPAEIKNDPAKRKQWKHVVLEKKRRNAIKDNFDDLVKLIQFPRTLVMEASL